MAKLLLVLSLLLLSACSLAPIPPADPAPAESTAPPRPQPSASRAIIDVDVQVADSDSENSLVVDEVWLDGQIAYRNVSRFILMLDGEYPAEMDGHEIRIKSQGYQEWSTRIRIRTKKARQIFLPIHLLKAKPQS